MECGVSIFVNIFFGVLFFVVFAFAFTSVECFRCLFALVNDDDDS